MFEVLFFTFTPPGTSSKSSDGWHTKQSIRPTISSTFCIPTKQAIGPSESSSGEQRSCWRCSLTCGESVWRRGGHLHAAQLLALLAHLRLALHGNRLHELVSRGEGVRFGGEDGDVGAAPHTLERDLAREPFPASQYDHVPRGQCHRAGACLVLGGHQKAEERGERQQQQQREDQEQLQRYHRRADGQPERHRQQQPKAQACGRHANDEASRVLAERALSPHPALCAAGHSCPARAHHCIGDLELQV